MRLIYAFLLAAFLMAQSGMAQSTPDQKMAPTAQTTTATATPEDTGPTAFVQASGNNFNMGTIVTWDFDLGYKINQHTSVDIGVPLFSTRTFFPIVAADYRYQTALGAPYLDVRYDTRRNKTNITSILTLSMGPNMVKTYSNGRGVVELFNHLDRNYQILNFDAKFTPFLNFGFGTGTVDRQVFPRPYELDRPYETLGLIGNGEVGGAFTFRKLYRLEGSAYGLSPVGPQKVYSRIVAPDSLLGWAGCAGVLVCQNENHNRFWDSYFETGGEYVNTYGSGPSRISRDNGFGAYLTINSKRFKNFSVMLGYTRSVHYAYDNAFIMLKYNFTSLLRNLTTGE
ncbi:MAG: hypothetical protein ACLQVG_16800 [Terriglobia bacterium]